jgi:hypothetical protein
MLGWRIEIGGDIEEDGKEMDEDHLARLVLATESISRLWFGLRMKCTAFPV